MATNVFDQFDSPAGGNVFDQFDEPSKRKTPKQMKIGREGFPEAFRQVLEEATPSARKFAAFGSFPRQLYEGAKQIIGREDPQAIEAQRQLQAREPGAALAGGVASMVPLSMIPGAGTVAGQAAMGGAISGLEPAGSLKERAEKIGLGTITAGGTAAGMKGLGMLAKPFIEKAGAKAAEMASREAVKRGTIDEAQAAGYVFPPTAIGGGRAAKVMESVGGGKATLAQEASLRNQAITNKIAREEAGLGPNEAISEVSLAKAREVMAQPYREIASLSPRASTALEKLKEVRLDAKDYWRKYAMEGDPAARKAAVAADDKAAAYEKLIDTEAKRVGRSDLLPALREARIRIAKNHNVESAVNLGNGDVDAKVIGRLLDRKGVNAVTGGLRTIGKVQQAFPRFVREAPSGESAPGVSYLRPLVTAGALGLAGYEGHERYGLSPYWMAAAAMPLVSGPARNIALSRLMQGAPQYTPGMAAQLTHAATGPLAQRLIPLSAVSGMQTQP